MSLKSRDHVRSISIYFSKKACFQIKVLFSLNTMRFFFEFSGQIQKQSNLNRKLQWLFSVFYVQEET